MDSLHFSIVSGAPESICFARSAGYIFRHGFSPPPRAETGTGTGTGAGTGTRTRIGTSTGTGTGTDGARARTGGAHARAEGARARAEGSPIPYFTSRSRKQDGTGFGILISLYVCLSV